MRRWSLLSMRGVMLACGFLVNMLLVRLVDESEMSSWLLFTSAVAVLSAVIGMGIPALVGRNLAAWRGVPTYDFHPVIMAAIDRVTMIGLMVIVSALSLRAFVPLHVKSYIVYASLVGFLASFLQMWTELLRGYGMAVGAMFMETLPNLFTMTLAALFLVYGYTPSFEIELVVVYAVGFILAIVAGFILFKHVFAPGLGVAQSGKRIRLLSDSWPIGVNNILQGFASQADLWVAGIYLESHVLVVYGLATRFTSLAYALQSASRGMLQEHVPLLYAQGKIEQMRSHIYENTRFNFLFSLSVLVGFVLIGKWVVALAFGDRYLDAWSIGVSLLAGRTLSSVFGPGSLLLYLTGYQHALPLRTGVGIVIYVPILILLTKQLGVYGTAAASIGFGLFLVVYSSWLWRRRFGFWVFEKPARQSG